MESVLSFNQYLHCLRVFFRKWLAVALVAAVLITVFQLLFSSQVGLLQASVIFSYDGIQDGRTPNGNRFSPDRIINADLIASAMETLGMDVDSGRLKRIHEAFTISAVLSDTLYKEITSHTSIYGEERVDDTEAVRRTSFYPTVYRLEFRPSRVGLTMWKGRELLKTILALYTENFYKEYCTSDLLSVSMRSVDYHAYDYSDAVTALETQLYILRDYLSALMDMDDTMFTSVSTGYSFSDLTASVDTLLNEDAAQLKTYISINHSTKDSQSLAWYYQYRIDTLNDQVREQQEYLNTLTSLLEEYKKTNSVFLSNMRSTETGELETYEFSRHSEMYDTLTTTRIACETGIVELEEEERMYRSMLEDLSTTENAGENSTVESRLNTLSNKIQDLLVVSQKSGEEFLRDVRMNRAVQISEVRGGVIWSGLHAVLTSGKVFLITECVLLGGYFFAAMLQTLFPNSKRMDRTLKMIKRIALRRKIDEEWYA